MTSGGTAERTRQAARRRSWATRVAGPVLLLLGTVLPADLRAATAPGCAGDCGGDGAVTIDEIIVLVAVAAGNDTVAACPAGDFDNDATITIDEIVAAVSNVLLGCSAVATPTPTPQPEPTPLGRRRFVLDRTASVFEAILAPGFPLSVGSFRGQTGGVVEDAYLDLEAGAPDAQGLATLAVVGGSEYIFVDGSNLGIVLCLKPRLPVEAAGLVACAGGFDFSIVTAIDHNIGQLGVDGFGTAQCEVAGGTLEGPNQVCAAGIIGKVCRGNAECDTESGTGDGACGFADATCSAGRVGEPCRADAVCDTAPDLADGVCGNPRPHPGVCNGPLQLSQSLGDSGPGAATIAPIPQLGLHGLPVELNIERATPCGDEGAGVLQPFALTTARSRTTIANFNNDTVSLDLDRSGQNFSCSNWSGSPARFVLNFPTLHQFQNNDVLTVFTFEDRNEPPGEGLP